MANKPIFLGPEQLAVAKDLAVVKSFAAETKRPCLMKFEPPTRELSSRTMESRSTISNISGGFTSVGQASWE